MSHASSTRTCGCGLGLATASQGNVAGAFLATPAQRRSRHITAAKASGHGQCSTRSGQPLAFQGRSHTAAMDAVTGTSERHRKDCEVPDEPAFTAAGDDRRLFPKPDSRPTHFWNDPDGDGHDCIDCPEGSIWRCDEPAHLPAPKVEIGPELREQLTTSATHRRRVAPPNRGLA